MWSNQRLTPSTISRPPEATTPVSGASTPMRMAESCAWALRHGRMPAPAAASVSAAGSRKFLRSMIFSLSSFLLFSLHVLELAKDDFRREDHDPDAVYAQGGRRALGIEACDVLQEDNGRVAV